MNINMNNLGSGLVFLLIGLFFAVDSLIRLDLGTAGGMGPGYFPVLVAVLLLCIAIGLIVSSFFSTETDIGNWPWRAGIFVLFSPTIFGLTIRSLGLVPASLLIALVASLASASMTPSRVAAVALGLTLFSAVLFKALLGLPIPLFELRWLGG